MTTDFEVTVKITGVKRPMTVEMMKTYVTAKLWYWFHGDAKDVEVISVHAHEKEDKS